jgi:hypothetical protein
MWSAEAATAGVGGQNADEAHRVGWVINVSDFTGLDNHMGWSTPRHGVTMLLQQAKKMGRGTLPMALLH